LKSIENQLKVNWKSIESKLKSINFCHFHTIQAPALENFHTKEAPWIVWGRPPYTNQDPTLIGVVLLPIYPAVPIGSASKKVRVFRSTEPPIWNPNLKHLKREIPSGKNRLNTVKIMLNHGNLRMVDFYIASLDQRLLIPIMTHDQRMSCQKSETTACSQRHPA
jgi:hypothetical protein